MTATADRERTHLSKSDPGIMLPKVPEITALFWLIKIITTGTGEAASDFLGNTSIPLAIAIFVLVFPLSLWLQFRAKRYIAPIYWSAVMLVAVVGTAAADAVHVVLHVPYVASSIMLAIASAYTFRRWYRSEGTLSIHSIVTRRRETYYWVTVMLTFALGTALGDMTATEFDWGFFASIVIFGVLFLLPGLARWRFRLNAIVAFWSAYVITRPFGASIADYLGKPHSISGRDYGDGTVVGYALIAFCVLVGWLTYRRSDVQNWAIVDPDDIPVDESIAVPGRLPEPSALVDEHT